MKVEHTEREKERKRTYPPLVLPSKLQVGGTPTATTIERLERSRARYPRNPSAPTLAIMASRSSTLVRPMHAISRAARCSTSAGKHATAVRAFSVSAGRTKELAGDIGALPNMRHAQRNPVGPLKVC